LFQRPATLAKTNGATHNGFNLLFEAVIPQRRSGMQTPPQSKRQQTDLLQNRKLLINLLLKQM